jgi:hypothetical protein
MATELSAELRQALASAPNGALELVDPVTKRTYVLVSADVYRRLRQWIGDKGDSIGSMSGLLADLAPEDWEDASSYGSPQP